MLWSDMLLMGLEKRIEARMGEGGGDVPSAAHLLWCVLALVSALAPKKRLLIRLRHSREARTGLERRL